MIELLPELCNASFKCTQLALCSVSPLLLLAALCKQLLQVYLQLSGCRLRSECCSACHTHDATDPLRYGRLLYSNTHTTKHVVINTTQHHHSHIYMHIQYILPRRAKASASRVFCMCVPPQNSTEYLRPSTCCPTSPCSTSQHHH